jgi:predicted outer membrane repeat protein
VRAEIYGDEVAAGEWCTLEVYDSTFASNAATGDDSEPRGSIAGVGGAIYAHNTNVAIHDTTFESNDAHDGYGGGGIYAKTAIVEIHDSTFQSNTAQNDNSGGGGAIYACERNILEIHGTIFQMNSGFGGGAISTYNEGTVKIHGSTFESNTASSCTTSEGGGAIRYDSDDDDLEIYDCTFKSNTATCYGGAIFLYRTGSGTHVIRDSTFESNNAGGSGGAIFSDDVIVKIYGSTFESNTADTADSRATRAPGGGTIFAYYQTGVRIYTSTFKLNKATSTSKGDLLYVDASSTVVLDKCTIDYDGSRQEDYFAQGTLVVRDAANSNAERGLELVKGDATSVYPSSSAGLCPAFSTQTVDWKSCGDHCQYPWGILCGTCPTGTTKVDVTATSANKYPFLLWACKCPAGNAGGNCAPCPSGKYMPASSTVVVPECVACNPGMYADSSGSSACTLCRAGQFGADAGLASDTCSGDCTDGDSARTHYCPLGSTSKSQNECTTCDMSTASPVMKGCTASGAGYCSDCIPGRYVRDGARRGQYVMWSQEADNSTNAARN